MLTKECPYCQQNIAEKGYDLHLKLCSKRPKDGELAPKPEPPKVEPPVAKEEIPEVGTAEYMEYWQQLTTRGQQNELARRKTLDKALETFAIEPTPVVTEQVSTTATTPDTEAKVTTGENGAMEMFHPQADPHFLVSENTVEALRVTEAISHKHPTNLLVTG